MSYAAMFLSTDWTCARTAVASDEASPVARTTMNGLVGGFWIYQVYISGAGSASSPLWRTSPMTPMIVDGGGAVGPVAVLVRRRCPTGSALPKSRRAIVWLMTITGGEFGPSCPVNPRPRRIGMPIAAK